MTRPEYIAILFIDIGFSRAIERCSWLEREFGVRYPDQLSASQAHECIERLKAIKAGLRERERELKPEEEEY